VHLVVVKQGEVELHARLAGKLGPEGVAVIWDRRQGERRTIAPPDPIDRRRRDRRRPPPPTWATLGFLMVPREDPPP
jgi:hypothetical protein